MDPKKNKTRSGIEKLCAILTRHRFRKKLPCIGAGYSVCRCCGKLIREEAHNRA